MRKKVQEMDVAQHRILGAKLCLKRTKSTQKDPLLQQIVRVLDSEISASDTLQILRDRTVARIGAERPPE